MTGDTRPRTLFVIAAGDTTATGLHAPAWRVRRFSPQPGHIPDAVRSLLFPIVFTALATFRALRVARHERPDVVMGEGALASLAVFLVGMVCGVPSVMKPFGAPAETRGAVFAAGVRIPHDLWMIEDDGTGQDALLQRAGVPSERIRTLPVAFGDLAAAPCAVAVPDGGRVIAWIGTWSGIARPGLVLDVLERVRAVVATTSCLMLADGDPPAVLRARVSAPGVSLSPLSPATRAGALAAADVLIAARTDTNKRAEVLDAMAAGVPVVAFDTGGTTHVVRDGETGVVIDDGDAEAMAAAVIDLLNHDVRRARLSDGARAFARARFVTRERRDEIEMEWIAALPARKDTEGGTG